MSSANYLNTVFNINLTHEGEDISEDYLLFTTINEYSSTLFDQSEAHAMEFIERHEFTTSKDKIRITGFSYFLNACPYYSSVEYYATHAKIGAAHLLMDDIFDLTPELMNSQNVGIALRMIRFISKYFRCHAEPIDEDIRETYPKFENLCQMFFETGENLIATGKDLSWVYEGFDILVDGHIPQVTLPPPESAEEYLERKINNFGMNFYFDLICVFTGESLSNDVRKSEWFKEFTITCSALCTLAADPTSFYFDISRGLTHDNYTVILIQKGFSVKEAIRRTILRYNQFFIKTLILISQMDKMNISEPDRKYLRVYLTTIRAVLEWASRFPTYNPNRIIKYCEVQDRNRAAKCVAEALCAIESI